MFSDNPFANGPDRAPQPAEAGETVIDGADATFAADVIEASQQRPVLVDFWAPSCEPCRTLGPLLEQQVRARGGAVRLVKINVDENPGVAGQLGVKSLPAVYGFVGGRPVDGFMGAVPESQIKAFVGRLLGKEAGLDIDETLARAEAALGAGDAGGAAQDFAAVLQAADGHPRALAGLARCYLAGGDVARAEELLNTVPEGQEGDAAIAGARAALAFAKQAGEAGDRAELDAKLAETPDDHAARFELAKTLAARGDMAGAADALLAIIAAEREWNDGAARDQLLKIFDAAGPASPVTKEGRRKLSSLLFS